jgi:hypothetical protein
LETLVLLVHFFHHSQLEVTVSLLILQLLDLRLEVHDSELMLVALWLQSVLVLDQLVVIDSEVLNLSLSLEQSLSSDEFRGHSVVRLLLYLIVGEWRESMLEAVEVSL